jgi:putative FmdB family regulatory protein
MPIYKFECKKCHESYDELASYDESGKYPSVVCPNCGSTEKDKLATSSNFNFSNPIGTDRWNSGSTGHDYRFKHNIPKVQAERKMAEVMSHMGSNPYGSTVQSDLKMGEGIHDPETRPGLS